MPRKFAERQRIHVNAKRILGLKRKQDRYEFMQQCIPAVIADGDADSPDDARDICEMLFDELEGLFDE